ncbi:MAG: VanZ family protein [Actinobacteria bacterium]|nr:VanZ family protein [Actinomycetota bacterium]
MPPHPLRRWSLPVAVYVVILTLSSIPGDALAGTPGWTAVAGHAAGYGLLAWAIHRAWDGKAAGLVAITAALVLGLVNELQQGLVAGRSPDVADLGVDGLGALAGVLVRCLRPRRPGSRPPGRGSAARR